MRVRSPDSIFSTFFRLGQVIETFRGKGIFQPAIDAAIEKLNRGEWIHLFGEGKVNQESSNPESPTAAQLLRFKWGIGRIIMEAQRPPVIIPMWLTGEPPLLCAMELSTQGQATNISGFDKLMPEGRPFPYKYFPKPGAALSITFGDPVPTKTIQDALGSLVHGGRLPEASRSANSALAEPSRPQAEERSGAVAGQGWLREPVSHAVEVLRRDTGVKGLDPDLAREITRVRSAVTAVIQEEVEALGRRVVLEVGRQ
ncbi:hypothetical protein BN946_scf184998.g26 [Trametes cinnabarina]|uniref:Tafazzin family protein n=1 Tax=Pycnoporus cinnabarinus TaxID=5643 RepID=A0A060S8C5_PYCCI|nr:hypothetical protein BN946_scf184998.g26 [Trametes cinnabarina]